MTRFMLDTDTCIDVIRKRGGAVLQRLLACSPDEVCLSSVTLGELEYGVAKSAAPERNRMALLRFVTPLDVLPYGGGAAAAYGHIRGELERAGTPIGPVDTMIAAHALSLGLTVVTDNEREFRRVPGLSVENWTV